jgi:hypothetical protein
MKKRALLKGQRKMEQLPELTSPAVALRATDPFFKYRLGHPHAALEALGAARRPRAGTISLVRAVRLQ